MNEYSFILFRTTPQSNSWSADERSDGGEDRTRTCKRFRAVVFKTTALPIRLPLRSGMRTKRTHLSANSGNSIYQIRCPTNKKSPGCNRTTGKGVKREV